MYNIYSNAQNDAWRYTLGKSGNRKLLVVGLNPSTANKEKSDPTVARVQKVTQNNGFDGFVMLNLYPVRATAFRTLSSNVDHRAFSENLRQIESVVATERNPVIWAAWGANILHYDFFRCAFLKLYSTIQMYDASWLHFGELTQSGHPRHPSRLSYSWRFSPFDIAHYVNVLHRPPQLRGDF